MRPHRQQPNRLCHPWDSPGKNTGVGCHFLLQCRKVKSENEVAQSCPTLSDPMDWSPPGSSIHGIFQARVLEWGAITFSYVSWYIPIYSYLHIILCNMFILNKFIFKWTLGLNMIFKVNFYLVKRFSERGLMMFFEWDRDLTSLSNFIHCWTTDLLYSLNILSSHIVVSQQMYNEFTNWKPHNSFFNINLFILIGG